MPSYSKELEDSVIAKLLNEEKPNISEISSETGIHENTLRKCKQRAIDKEQIVSKKHFKPEKYNSEDKFLIAAKTVGMSENELSEYCRSKGLYVDEVRAWKLACMSVNGTVAENNLNLI